MSNPRKYFPHGSVLFTTFSLEQGLLLLSNPLSLCIIQSCIARALELYPVRLCAVNAEGNHIHMVYVVICPTAAANFIGYLKAEIAHRMNILFGWKKRTVWCDGYDSPVVLTARRALIALAYLYVNPAKDNLVESVDEYPGFSTWKMFLKGEHEKQWKFIRRPVFRRLSPDAHNLAGYSREAERVMLAAKTSISFKIEPNAWLAPPKVKR